MSHSLTLADDQINLILELLEWEKNEISSDLQAEFFNFEGKRLELSRASSSVLESRYWEASNLQSYLEPIATASTTTTTPTQ